MATIKTKVVETCGPDGCGIKFISVCSACGAEVQEYAIVCPGCGEKLEREDKNE